METVVDAAPFGSKERKDARNTVLGVVKLVVGRDEGRKGSWGWVVKCPHVAERFSPGKDSFWEEVEEKELLEGERVLDYGHLEGLDAVVVSGSITAPRIGFEAVRREKTVPEGRDFSIEVCGRNVLFKYW